MDLKITSINNEEYKNWLKEYLIVPQVVGQMENEITPQVGAQTENEIMPTNWGWNYNDSLGTSEVYFR